MRGLLLAALVAANPAPSEKVAPALSRALAGGPAEMLVVLRDQADLRPAAGLPTKGEKGRFVAGTLRAAAARSQAPLLAWMKGRGLPARSFWIVDAVLTKGSAGDAAAIAARDDVLRVEANPLVPGLPPEPPPPSGSRPLAVTTATPGVSQVNAPAVWTSGDHGEGVVVADADTGVLWSHQALVGAYRGTTASGTVHDYNWHDAVHADTGSCGSDSPVPCDANGHGTRTTGLMVGDDGAGNQVGTAPGARWIACRNMDAKGNGTPARYLECMEFFVAPYPVGGTPADGDPARAPDIVNNSWICPPSEGCSATTLESALEAQRAAGILNVGAAGNDGPACSTLAYPPAISASVLTVGALSTGTTTIASFSSLGPVTADGSGRQKPDAVAPGTGIASSSLPGPDTYASGNGTSFASPLTAGVAALVLSAQPALRRVPPQLAAILTDSAAAISASSCGTGPVPNATYGWGLVDASAAVSLAATRPVVSSVSPGWGPTSGGTALTIGGANFRAGDGVVIGGVPVTPSSVTATSIAVTSPPHAAGPVDVAVVDSAASQTGTLAGGFSYCDGTNGCATGPLLLYTLTPCRLVDTRLAAGALGGPALAPNTQRTFRLEGSCGIAEGARALALNVTAVDPDAWGDLRVYPAGIPAPTTSVVDFPPGAVRAAFVVAPLDPYGRLTVQCDMAAGAVRGTDLLLDVSGYFR